MNCPSTQNVAIIPGIADVKRISKAAAMLDAILLPEWDARYFSYNSNWSEGEEMGSMRNGSGDDYFILFTEDGAIIIGFAHESEVAGQIIESGKPPIGIFDFVPEPLKSATLEPAFSPDETTFCLWRLSMATEWSVAHVAVSGENDDPDGSESLLFLMNGDPKSYSSWAEDYLEQSIPLDIVEAVYRLEPLTEKMVYRLNPERLWQDLAEDIAEIGYPLAKETTKI